MSEKSLAACLATKQREAVALRLGLGSESCGDPPFDSNVPELAMFSWPWSDWPIYDPAIFDVDRKRIVRWYQARGFYDADVKSVSFELQKKPVDPEQRCTTDSCRLTLHVSIDEGQPVLVESVAVVIVTGGFSDEVQKKLGKQPELQPGDRFDESVYAADKDRLLALLKENSYAGADVTGDVEIDKGKHSARVRYLVDAGRFCYFGTTTVVGNEQLNADAIIQVANIKPGTPYKQSDLTDAERAVYALGVFSSVRIEPQLVPDDKVVNLIARVSPGRMTQWRLGVGVMSGSLQRGSSDETFNVPEWDVHLRAAYRDENFLGDMRKLTLEDRPRVIFLKAFPGVADHDPHPGNVVTLQFEQPRFPERRTVLFFEGQWDLGPDPYFGYFRHDITTKIGLRRKFFHSTLSVQAAVAHDFYEIIQSLDGREFDAVRGTVSSYRLPYLEQVIALDLRDDSRRPKRGVYLSSATQEAFRLGYGSWNYFRWLPEARAYQKLFWNIVLAERLAFGALFVFSHKPGLDPTSSSLGPQAYRLRGGGANSDRGFQAGQLGAGLQGGKRRWEGSIELRVPLASDFGFVLFLDSGDVNAGNAIRFDHPHAAAGFGLRYFTAFAPIRFDAGWRIPDWQVFGPSDEPKPDVGVLPSAIHITIGEAF